MATVKHLRETGDRFARIEGAVSGTLSFIFTSLQARLAAALHLGNVFCARNFMALLPGFAAWRSLCCGRPSNEHWFVWMGSCHLHSAAY